MLHALTIIAVLAAPQRADSFASGLEAAKAADQPLIVFAHGSDWCLHGERMKADVWDLENRVQNVVFADIDVLETPNEANTKRNEGFEIKSVRTYPAMLAFAPDGTRIGLRAGATLPRQGSDATKVLRLFVQSAQQRIDLQKAASAAQASGNVAAETAALHAIVAQDLDVPSDVLKRLQEVDPGDVSGVRRRAAFGPFHQFVAQASSDGKEGRGQEAIDRLQPMLDEGVYTPSQQAWIHNAMGSAYRYWEGHAEQAEAQFRAAADVAPESVGGLAGRRLAMQLYGDPSLESGWASRHMTLEPSKWSIEDVQAPLKRGTYTVTFLHSRGRHGLDILDVRLLDGRRVIVKDTHEGFSGGAKRDHVYTLKLLWDVEQPVLQITAKGSGGTNGHGRIVWERPGGK